MFGNSLQKQTTKQKIYLEKGKQEKKEKNNLIKMNGRKEKNQNK